MALQFTILVATLLLFPFSVAAQSVCTESEIRTEMHIAATPEAVWDLLINVNDYATWHPYIKEISGELEVGKRIRVSVINLDSTEQTFSAYILELDPCKQLSWGGLLGFCLVPNTILFWNRQPMIAPI
jgi:hypothetical protein